MHRANHLSSKQSSLLLQSMEWSYGTVVAVNENDLVKELESVRYKVLQLKDVPLALYFLLK